METEKVIKTQTHIGYKCDDCGEKVLFPLCKNADTDRYEALAWGIYTTYLNSDNRLCWKCKLNLQKGGKQKWKQKKQPSK